MWISSIEIIGNIQQSLTKLERPFLVDVAPISSLEHLFKLRLMCYWTCRVEFFLVVPILCRSSCNYEPQATSGRVIQSTALCISSAGEHLVPQAKTGRRDAASSCITQRRVHQGCFAAIFRLLGPEMLKTE